MNSTFTNFYKSASQKQLTTVAILVLAGVGAYVASGYVINDDLTGLVVLALPLIFLLISVSMLNNWRIGLYVFLIWLLFEDIIRKYAGNNMVIFFGKDVLVAIVYISYSIKARKQSTKSFRPPFLLPLLVLIWFGAIQIFNPGSTSVWFGLLGFKMFFFYVPLFAIGFALVNSELELRRFFTVNLLLCLVITSLGIAQSILGHTFLNPPQLQEDIKSQSELYRVTPISGLSLYRPNSVFVSHGRYCDFLMVAWLFSLGYSGYLILRHPRGRWLAFLAVMLTLAGAVLSGSRGTFMWAGINIAAVSIAFLWGAPWRQREVIRVLRTLGRIAVGGVLAMVLLAVIFPEALGSRLALYSETLNPSSSASELGGRAWDYPVRNFMGAFSYDRWPYGYGIGTSGLGTQYVIRIFHVKPMRVGVESGYGTLVVEMGIVGLILWLIMSFAVVISAWKVVVKLRGSPFFPLGFLIFWYAFVLLFPATFAGMQPYEDFLINSYLWLTLGVLFRLPQLSLMATAQAQAKSLAARGA